MQKHKQKQRHARTHTHTDEHTRARAHSLILTLTFGYPSRPQRAEGSGEWELNEKSLTGKLCGNGVSFWLDKVCVSGDAGSPRLSPYIGERINKHTGGSICRETICKKTTTVSQFFVHFWFVYIRQCNKALCIRSFFQPAHWHTA